MTHAVRTFLALLDVEKLTQLAFAQRCPVSHSTITRFVQGREPSPELLAYLCTKWTNPQHGLELLRAHLLDEIERSGRHLAEVRITLESGPSDEDLDRALVVLAQACQQDADLRTTLLGLSRLIERHSQRLSEPIGVAAEDPAPFNSANPVQEVMAQEDDRRAAAKPGTHRGISTFGKPPPTKA